MTNVLIKRELLERIDMILCGDYSDCVDIRARIIATLAQPAPEVEAVEAASWSPPETAPKNRHILANCGWPWPVVAMWSDYAECWVIAMQEGNVCDGKSDPGFITEHERELIGWMEMPALPPRTK